jgi:hypothetical protein
VEGIKLPSFNNRAVFVGKTGCGKTTLAERICANHDVVVVLDSKAELFWQGYDVYADLGKVKSSTNPKVIWQPNPHEQNQETYESFFAWIYDRKNTVCYVDEVLAVCKNSQDIPFSYRAILTRGRSRGIGSFNSTQAPVFVPHWILSQAEYYFVFKMKLEGDREKVEKITGIPRAELNALKNHEFYYADDSDYYPRKIKLRL